MSNSTSFGLFVLLCVTRIASAKDTLPLARIARFDGDRAAAISYTFDDNLRDQYTVAVPMLNQQGFKGTFFVIPGTTAETEAEAMAKQSQKRAWGGITWSELKEMASQGHEIGSHTWSHSNLTQVGPEELETQLEKAYQSIETHIGKPPLTVAFPFNASNTEVQAAAQRHYLAYRSYQIGTSGKTTEDSLNKWAKNLINDKKWGVVMTHAVANGYAAFSNPEILRNHFKFVKEQDIWVDTFANIARYEKERDNSKLLISGDAGTFILFLTTSLDPQLYNIPLTLVIDPVGRVADSVERSGKALPIQSRNGLIYIQATPSAKPIKLTLTQTH